ncbi:MAG: hypothetical protein J6I64_03700 [Lachnospiraceae bacterium]|nr:hypothetical protein [Lachnospiraceae bacterium]
MSFLIAADSGGTKTETVLFDETGHIWYRDVDLGCNPLDIGLETARKRFEMILRRVIAQVPVSAAGKNVAVGVVKTQSVDPPVAAMYGAMAGSFYYKEGEMFPSERYTPLGIARFRTDVDGRSMLSSHFYQEEECCGVVCGTGCSSWVRKAGQTRLIHCGGWGYLVDALGSGYALGRDAVRAAARAEDGRGPDTVLLELVERELGTRLAYGIPQLYAGGRRKIASLARLIFEGCRLGDAVSQQLMEQGAGYIAELIWVADSHMKESYPVVMGGGIVKAFPEYLEAIRHQAPSRARLILAEAPPVFGAAVEAMRECGLACNEEFRQRFFAEYNKMSML